MLALLWSAETVLCGKNGLLFTNFLILFLVHVGNLFTWLALT